MFLLKRYLKAYIEPMKLIHLH